MRKPEYVVERIFYALILLFLAGVHESSDNSLVRAGALATLGVFAGMYGYALSEQHRKENADGSDW